MEEEIIKKEHHFFRTLFFIIILLLALCIIYGKFLGNKGLIIKDYEIKDEIFPESLGVLRIAHFSDILYDNKEDKDYIKEIVEKINKSKPDIIIFSGNLIKEKYNLDEQEVENITQELSKLNSKYGKYYVSGNSDKETPSYDAIMQKSDFISLNDNKDIIYSKTKEKIMLVGLDSKSGTSIIDEVANENYYKIIIFSNSDKFDDIKKYNFNLFLSSNSLNGLINIPFIQDFFTRDGSKKYINNYYEKDNKKLYVNSGIGTDIIDFRLFNKPSINMYKISKK